MADVRVSGDGGQAIGRDSTERAGLALLARFFGAVCLVLVGGLFGLDRALLKANHNQARLDAQSAGLLTESFVSGQASVLDRITDLAAAADWTKDSLETGLAVERLLEQNPTIRQVWVLDQQGAALLEIAGRNSGPPIPAMVLQRLEALRSTTGVGITVTPDPTNRALIAMVRAEASRKAEDSISVGVVFDGQALKKWLERTDPESRQSLIVSAGLDTVASLGEARERAQALATARHPVHLPNGGTWQVTSTHALASRWVRIALWGFGTIGVLFLALGLLREQKRALNAAGRSIELERLYSDVKRANQAKSEFLANVSHELRTPLNAIVGFVELLRDGFYGDLSPRQVPPVDRIAASATHLRHLVDQVLDIAKIAAGRLEVHAETIVLRPFVLNIASELESLVSEKGLAFSITAGASLPRVRTDPTHLRQILINLIGNAVKYTPTGMLSVRARLVGPAPTGNARQQGIASAEEAATKILRARVPRAGTWVALQVVDTGVGIAATDLERIFDEFEQVNAGPRGDSMQRGTGLGLAISRRLARLLGGDISVESELGRGSTFTVWLPVNPADLTREPIEVPAAAASVPSA